MKKTTLVSYLIVGIITAIVAGYLVFAYAPRSDKRYNSEAIKWLADNPGYAEKIYSAHQKYLDAANQAMLSEIDGIGGGVVKETKESK
ncbi:MAG: hypothetical protein WC549_00475 [Actinomycetota bacterium]